MNEDDLKNRTKKFALRIIKLVETLPNTFLAKHIGGQLVRSGTSVPANYRAASSEIKSRFYSENGHRGRRSGRIGILDRNVS
jgi:four helix bundle protein